MFEINTSEITPELTTPSSWREASRRLTDERRVWTCPSGVVLTGREISHHIERAIEWLERWGWNPNVEKGIPRNTSMALLHTSPGGVRDRDSYIPAFSLVNLLSYVSVGEVGSPFSSFESWEGRAERTWIEVREALRTAAAFAREFGPS